MHIKGKTMASKKKKSSNTQNKSKSLKKSILALCVGLAIVTGTQTISNKSTSSQDTSSKQTTQTVQTTVTEPPAKVEAQPTATATQYTTKNEVAQYICDNDKLPPNYVSKDEAMRLYEEKTGNKFTSWNFNPLRKLGIMIGGDNFSNREKKLPQGSYKEADVDYFEVNRGKNRLIYAKNCNIYHTNDHYQTFTKLNIQKNR